jgi:hypothetical protein
MPTHGVAAAACIVRGPHVLQMPARWNTEVEAPGLGLNQRGNAVSSKFAWEMFSMRMNLHVLAVSQARRPLSRGYTFWSSIGTGLFLTPSSRFRSIAFTAACPL